MNANGFRRPMPEERNRVPSCTCARIASAGVQTLSWTSASATERTPVGRRKRFPSYGAGRIEMVPVLQLSQ